MSEQKADADEREQVETKPPEQVEQPEGEGSCGEAPLPPPEPEAPKALRPYVDRPQFSSMISPSRELSDILYDVFRSYGEEVFLFVLGHVIEIDRRYILLLRSFDPMETDPIKIRKMDARVKLAIRAIAGAIGRSEGSQYKVDRLFKMLEKANYTISAQQQIKPGEGITIGDR